MRGWLRVLCVCGGGWVGGGARGGAQLCLPASALEEGVGGQARGGEGLGGGASTCQSIFYFILRGSVCGGWRGLGWLRQPSCSHGAAMISWRCLENVIWPGRLGLSWMYYAMKDVEVFHGQHCPVVATL